jgi:Ca-activated chloride channel family protein
VCAVLLSVGSAVVRSQEPAAPTQTAAAPPARIEVTLTGGKGRAAPVLTKEDVRVYVDGVERPVVSFEKQAQPVSYGLVVDNSGSLRSQIGQVVSAAKFLVESGGPDDEAFVLRFAASDRINVLQPLTADKRALHGALDSMYIEGGFTAVLDALHDAGKYLTTSASRAGAPGRRLVLALITDGDDRGSSYTANEVLKLLKDGGVQVYCVGLTAELENVPTLTKLNKREKAKSLLAKIAEETGGRVFYAEKSGELEEVVHDVARSMRTRYVVGYAPPEPGGKGSGKVEVKVVGAAGKEKLKAQIITPVEKRR